MATPELQLAVDFDLAFVGLGFRVVGTARSAFTIAFEPVRAAVFVIFFNKRLNERFQSVFGMRLVMDLNFKFICHELKESILLAEPARTSKLVNYECAARISLVRLWASRAGGHILLTQGGSHDTCL